MSMFFSRKRLKPISWPEIKENIINPIEAYCRQSLQEAKKAESDQDRISPQADSKLF